MIKKFMVLTLTLLLAGLGQALAVEPPSEGEVFPDITLQVPDDADHREYLGLEAESGTFGLENVQAQLIIVELLSIYCPYCQKEAESVNELYERIASRGLDDRIKLLAMAPGNSAFEVGTWIKRYDTQFPIFPDPDYTFHKVLGETGTPHFFVLDMEDGQGKVLYSASGSFGPVASFLEPFEKMVKERGQ